MCVIGAPLGPPLTAMRSRGGDVRGTACVVTAGYAGADVATRGAEDGCRDVADASALAPPRRPIVTCTYPAPSGAPGQSTLAQLPRLRETGRTVPPDT